MGINFFVCLAGTFLLTGPKGSGKPQSSFFMQLKYLSNNIKTMCHVFNHMKNFGPDKPNNKRLLKTLV